MSAERDTKFQKFAKRLYDEIGTLDTRDIQRFSDYTSFNVAAKKLIAQRVYDLMAHATRHINKNAIYTEHPHFDAFMLAIVPDMTEWPQKDTSNE